MDSAASESVKALKERNSSNFTGKSCGILIPVLGLMGALLSVPRVACANSGDSGNNFLETIGISVAVGTVLGASTLPFYNQPGKHAINVAYGASLGAVAGVGASLYGLIAGASNLEESYHSGPYEEKMLDSGRSQNENPDLRKHSTVVKSQLKSELNGIWNGKALFAPVGPNGVWVSLVSLTW
ncbi:hypothetical protein WDW86_00690 [Bdellovibrionota bacterium FG-2]